MYNTGLYGAQQYNEPGLASFRTATLVLTEAIGMGAEIQKGDVIFLDDSYSTCRDLFGLYDTLILNDWLNVVRRRSNETGSAFFGDA